MAQWATDYHDMSPFRVWKFKDDTLLGVGCSLSRVVFHEIQVREMTGKGEFTRATAKTSGLTPPSSRKSPRCLLNSRSPASWRS